MSRTPPPNGHWSSGRSVLPDPPPRGAQHSGAKERGLSPPAPCSDRWPCPAGRQGRQTAQWAWQHPAADRLAADRPSRPSTPCATGRAEHKGPGGEAVDRALALPPVGPRWSWTGGLGPRTRAGGVAGAPRRALPRRRVHPGSSQLCSPVLSPSASPGAGLSCGGGRAAWGHTLVPQLPWDVAASCSPAPEVSCPPGLTWGGGGECAPTQVPTLDEDDANHSSRCVPSRPLKRQ